MLRMLTDDVLDEIPEDERQRCIDHWRWTLANIMRGEAAAWAVLNVPGTKLALVSSSIVAFARDTGHAPVPDRVSRYVDAIMGEVAA